MTALKVMVKTRAYLEEQRPTAVLEETYEADTVSVIDGALCVGGVNQNGKRVTRLFSPGHWIRCLTIGALALFGCAAPTDPAENVASVNAELSTAPAPCIALNVTTITPRRVVRSGALLMAEGCGLSAVVAVRVAPDALVGGAAPVPFVVLDDRHVLFASGEAAGGELADVWFDTPTRHQQRFFGWVEESPKRSEPR